MTAELSRLHLTVSRELLAKLEAARLALSHARPGATLADVIEVDLVLARDEKKKALVARPANEPRSINDAHITAAVRREVWKRDGGCCQWPVASGGVCGSRLRVELDHVVPRAQGGASTLENLRVLCRAHNDLAARIAFGDACMDRFTRGVAGWEGEPGVPARPTLRPRRLGDSSRSYLPDRRARSPPIRSAGQNCTPRSM